jgi:hypothetical protein
MPRLAHAASDHYGAFEPLDGVLGKLLRLLSFHLTSARVRYIPWPRPHSPYRIPPTLYRERVGSRRVGRRDKMNIFVNQLLHTTNTS